MKNFWKKFKSGLFTKAQFVTGVTVVLVTTSAMVFAFNQLSLVIFNQGETISSTDVNANFEYLDERIKYLAGNQFEIKTNYDSSPYRLNTDTTVTIDFDQVVVDFSPGGNAQAFVDNDQLTISDGGSFNITYEYAGEPVNSSFANGSVFMEIEPFGSTGFTAECCASGGGSYFTFNTTTANIPSTAGGLISLGSGDTIRFRMSGGFVDDDKDISLMKIKIEKN